MFHNMIAAIQEDIIRYMMRITPQVRVQTEEQPQKVRENRSEEENQVKRPVHVEQQLGRNDPCSCGSGKKYKKCCGSRKE